MKLIYKKPKIFPKWTKFGGDEQIGELYTCQDDGIVFSCDKLPHYNHIEMSGFETSTILSYKIDKDRCLKLYRFCVFPQIRVVPNETRGSLSYNFKSIELSFDKPIKADKVEFDGLLNFYQSVDGVEIKHMLCPACDKKALIEKIVLKNTVDKKQTVTVKNKKPLRRILKVFFDDSKSRLLFTDVYFEGKKLNNRTDKLCLEPFEEKTILVCNGVDRLDAKQIEHQFVMRKQFVDQMKSCMQVITPDKEVNRMIEFCKIRASESIFKTKNGLMHAPGGGNYYAALWTNDQCEYANPLFAYLNYSIAKEQSVNCYKLFARYADKNKAIPSSIVACGDDVWNGAGDRGDNSMFLYGLCRYLLSTGDRQMAIEFLPSIEIAQRYVKGQITADGIVKSDSDELENRFESGKANLSTACITYDAFISLNYLYKELGEYKKAEEALVDAMRIRDGIENYFGAKVEGYETYRYCKEESNLRSWICLPLVMGIDCRREQTVSAMLSDKLCKDNGMLSRSGEKTYWDRSLLYALRGLFYVGESEKAVDLLGRYTKERLLGFHPPYPIEAFPEGNSAQLSAESALYVRIFTEGILGYRPIGFNKFEIKPNLPNGWEYFEISNMQLCGKKFDLYIKNGDEYTVTVNGEDIKIDKGEKKYIVDIK
ncbi:MAG: hypothetical protein K2O35_05790 [Clostridia bacterium]|nr:hypothetical protein [Clostridia bacterium]